MTLLAKNVLEKEFSVGSDTLVEKGIRLDPHLESVALVEAHEVVVGGGHDEDPNFSAQANREYVRLPSRGQHFRIHLGSQVD